MPVHERLDEPYMTRSNPGGSGGGGGSGPGGGGGPGGYFPDPDNLPLPVSIAGRSFLVDTSRNTPLQERFRRSSVQLLNSQQNIDKGESALTTPEVWRRTYKSWHHGAGQQFADRSDSDEFRYYTSKGVNPWERWQISLLHDTSQISGWSTFSGLQANGHTVVLRATRRDVYITDGVLSATFTLPVGALIATDGYYVYVWGSDNSLTAHEIVNNSLQITFPVKGTAQTVPLGSETVVCVFFANFKLVVATGTGKVYDMTGFASAAVTGATAPTLPAPVYTPPIPTVRFVAGCAGKKAVYLLSTNGDKSSIHELALSSGSSGGALDTLLYAGVAAELPEGEIGYTIYNYLGYIAVGTSKGFRFAVTGEGLTYGPLIETPTPVTAFEGQSKFLYYSLAGFDGDNGIGRADLSQFVADLQPAYASDLMAGRTVEDRVTFINTLSDGRIVFGLASGGVYAETNTYVQEGTLTGSGWTFNVVDQKLGMYVNTQTSVGSGGSGRLHVSYDTLSNEYFLGEFVEAQQRFDMTGATFYSANLRAELNPSPDSLNTPKVYSVEMRSTYIRGKSTEWQVPCILHDAVEMDNGTVESRNVLEDYEHLLYLVETGQQFHYVEDGSRWTVYATDFIWSPQERSQSTGWQGVFTIYFREVR